MEQFPSPDLVKDVGVVAWLLMAVVISGIVTIGFFLRRITQAMDRMAAAQEATPALVSRLETLFTERMTQQGLKLDNVLVLAEEHVRIARMWERTEAPGRQVKPHEERNT